LITARFRKVQHQANNSNAPDVRALLALSSRLLAAADLSRYLTNAADFGDDAEARSRALPKENW
jgi:hypothetical protein